MKTRSDSKQPTKNLPDRIRPGEYTAICYRTDYGICQGGEKKLFVRFRIYGGEHHGMELFMACPLPKKSRKSGRRAKLGYCHKLYTQWLLALGRRPHERERFKKDIFPSKMYSVQVRDTKRKYSTGKVMPAHVQYSVIDTILEPLTGVPVNEA
jgi:hypothetical protein